MQFDEMRLNISRSKYLEISQLHKRLVALSTWVWTHARVELHVSFHVSHLGEHLATSFMLALKRAFSSMLPLVCLEITKLSEGLRTTVANVRSFAYVR